METVFNYFMQWSSVDYQMTTRFFLYATVSFQLSLNVD